MKKSLIIIFAILSFQAIAEEGNDIFTRKYLMQSEHEAIKRLIKEDLNIIHSINILDSNDFNYGIVTKSPLNDSLIILKGSEFNSFLEGAIEAYNWGNKFIVSPEMIWMLIVQGFSHHLRLNPEIRNRVIKKEFEFIITDEELLREVKSRDTILTLLSHEFTKVIDKDLENILSTSFAKNSEIEEISKLVYFHKQKDNFEFVKLMYPVLNTHKGKINVELQGKTEEWEMLLQKVQQLEKYDLKWWTVRLEIILKEIIKISKGYENPFFWKKMINDKKKNNSIINWHKYEKRFRKISFLDGWILDLYPYDKYGKRIKTKKLKYIDDLPKEIVKFEFYYNHKNENGENQKIPLELWSGFFGLQQNRDDFSLKPKIGWLIKEKHSGNPGLEIVLDPQKRSRGGLDLRSQLGISIKVENLPNEVFQVDSISKLIVHFTDKIMIPDKFAKVKIDTLYLYGEIEDEEIERIRNLFPNTKLYINGELIE